jgi:hypothetical protein
MLARPELVNESSRSALYNLKQAESYERLELGVVEVGHSQSAHRHQHRIDLALAEGPPGQVVEPRNRGALMV